MKNILALTTALACVPISGNALAEEQPTQSIWLESLDDRVPNQGDIPDGFRLIPIGLKYQHSREPVAPRKSRPVHMPGVYKYETQTFIISPARTGTIIIPEIWEDGKLNTPGRTKVITHPPVLEQRTTKQVIRPSETYEALTHDIPRVRLTKQLSEIEGYALVDMQGTKLKSWSYHDGKLVLNIRP